MAISKDMRFYNDGLARAYEIVKIAGVEELEREIKRRGVLNIPRNIPAYLLKEAAREYAKLELKIVAVAMADTIANDMAMPPSVIVKYLDKFNKKCDEYRDDPSACERAASKLDQQYALNETIKKFNNGGKKDE